MKFNRFTKILAMTAALAIAVTATVSCSGGEASYKVNVKNALGDAYTSGIVVQFMQNGEKVAMQAVNKDGVAEKTLAKGEYDIELSFTDNAEAYHYEGGAKVTAKSTEIDVILANVPTGETTVIFADGKEYDTYGVSEGCSYVTLEKNARTYFLFTPTQAGEYEFSIKDSANVEIGYYGAPHYVQAQNTAEITDNSFIITVKASMIGTGAGGTSTYVIGIDSKDDKTANTVLAIDRLGDPKKTIEDEPWEIYKATHEMTPYTLPEGTELCEFDLEASTDKYKLVLNEEDGFYHMDTKDGPLVYVRLTEDCDYIACFGTIIQKQGILKYFYDGKGTDYENFVKRENYTDCVSKYIECADENSGVYPLTEDLKYIIQQHGDYAGWWNIEGHGYIFRDMNGNPDSSINAEIAWLLMCCYAG